MRFEICIYCDVPKKSDASFIHIRRKENTTVETKIFDDTYLTTKWQENFQRYLSKLVHCSTGMVKTSDAIFMLRLKTFQPTLVALMWILTYKKQGKKEETVIICEYFRSSRSFLSITSKLSFEEKFMIKVFKLKETFACITNTRSLSKLLWNTFQTTKHQRTFHITQFGTSTNKNKYTQYQTRNNSYNALHNFPKAKHFKRGNSRYGQKHSNTNYT